MSVGRALLRSPLTKQKHLDSELDHARESKLAFAELGGVLMWELVLQVISESIVV